MELTGRLSVDLPFNLWMVATRFGAIINGDVCNIILYKSINFTKIPIALFRSLHILPYLSSPNIERNKPTTLLKSAGAKESLRAT